MEELNRDRYEELMVKLLASSIAGPEMDEPKQELIKDNSPLTNMLQANDAWLKQQADHFDVRAISQQVIKQFAKRRTSGEIEPEELYVICTDSFYNRPYSNEQPYLIQAQKLLNTAIFTIEAIFYIYGHQKYPALLIALARMYQIKEQFKLLSSLEEPRLKRSNKGGELQVKYQYSSATNVVEVSEEKLSQSIRDYFTLILLPLASNIQTVPDSRAREILGKRHTKVKSSGQQPDPPPKQTKLFSNTKDVNQSFAFQLPQLVADTMNRTIRHINEKDIKAQFNNKREPAFRVPGPDDGESGIHLDPEQMKIKTADAAAEQLLRIRDAKVIQTFFALWKHANLQATVRFRDTPISDVMRLVLKASGKTNYSTEDRRSFSEVLNYLSSITMTVQYIAERVGKKGKSKPVLRENRGVKLFKMEAEYAIKKQFQNLPKSELLNEHFDKTVITRFSGQLIPGNEDILRDRGHIFFDSLLHFDANKDQTAIVLGYAVQTRFNQITDKDKKLSWSRSMIVDLCDYGKTDAKKPSIATGYIRNTMNKLLAAGIISGFEGLTNSNTDTVDIYPPVAVTKQLES